jgi:thiol:disulfide interchange protein DsbD
VKVAFDLEIPATWHIYPAGKKPLFGNPTVFEFADAEVAGKIVEPPPLLKKEEGIGDIDFHEGKITVTVPIKVAGAGRTALQGTLKYQICDPNQCFDGETALSIPLAVAGAAAPAVQSVPDKPQLPFVKVLAVRPHKTKVKVGESFKVSLDLEIQAGHYIYPHAPTTSGKPTLLKIQGAQVGDAWEESKPKTHKVQGLDPYEAHEGTVTMTAPLHVEKGPAPGPFEAKAKLVYQICNEDNCFDNATSFTFPLEILSGEEQPAAASEEFSQYGFTGLILLGILGGLISLVMPCTYPLIPITLTYFVKQAAGSRSHGLVLSSLYSFGIILTFTGLGFMMSVLLGAGGARTFAANPWVNLTVGSLFLWFAGSLFGWYEIQLPFGLGAKLAGGGQRKGAGGAFILGLLFAIVTFTCTIPIAGTILSFAAGQERFAALLAMLAYSVTMSLPFFFMGLFPGMIKEVPKSGGWLTTVKVSMGFVEVALACFYYSKADQAWDFGILTRWVILSVYLGTCVVVCLYLLHFFRRVPSLLRVFFAVAFLLQAGFVVYGLTGKPLGLAETIIPPPPIHGTTLPRALEDARKQNKPLFIEFTGVT